jgi:hypothetical protein
MFKSTGAGAMPRSSFLGVGILIGLIAGAVYGLQYGDLAPAVGIGLVAGAAVALVIDWLARLKPGRGDGG